jgi:hypothetical protein
MKLALEAMSAAGPTAAPPDPPASAPPADGVLEPRRTYHDDAPKGAETPLDRRIDYICAAMALGNWHGYLSRVELAGYWGTVEATIRHYSADAHRALKRDPEELERRKAELAAWCDSVRDHAMTHVHGISGLPDYASALKAAELAAKFEGIEIDQKTKVEMSGPGGGPVQFAPVIMIPPERSEDDGRSDKPNASPSASGGLETESGPAD